MYTFHTRVFLIFEKNYFSKTEEMVERTSMLGDEIFRESVVAFTRVGASEISDRAISKPFFRKGCRNYVTFTKYIRKLSYKHKPQAQKWFP